MTKRNSSSIRASIVAALAVGLLSSCSHHQTKASGARMKSRRASASLQLALKKQQSLIEELRERNLVLEQRIKSGAADPAPAPNSVPVKVETAASSIPSDLPANMSVGSDASSDQILYGKVLDAYARHDLAETQKTTEALVRNARDSIHTDNALYLTGRLALEKTDRALALKYMNRILKDFARGDKAVSALFLRSMIQKQLGQFAEAKQDLMTLAKVYPGSPEAQRVRWELKTFATGTSESRPMKKEL